MLPLRLISKFMEKQTIQNALISVFDKQGIDELVTVLHESKITIYSTGGTFEYIKSLGIPAIKIETLTGYPEMLEGRVCFSINFEIKRKGNKRYELLYFINSVSEC